MNYFDAKHCEFDDQGLPHLRRHTCGRCGHTCQPAEQSLFTLDDGTADGLVATTPCPGCNSLILSALGSPEFLTWIIKEPLFTGDGDYLHAEFAPIAAAVRGAH